MPKSEVEIIPWVPDFALSAHSELLQYIRQRPAGSQIGVEISPAWLSEIKSLFPVLPKSPDYRFPTSSGALALMDAIFECEKRKLEIIPLETAFSHLAESRAKHGIESELASEKAEIAFAKKIESRLRKVEGGLPVLVAYNRAEGLRSILAKSGIRAGIFYDLFYEKEKVRELVRCGRNYSIAVRKKMKLLNQRQGRRTRIKLQNMESELLRISSARSRAYISFERSPWTNAFEVFKKKLNCAKAGHGKISRLVFVRRQGRTIVRIKGPARKTALRIKRARPR